MIERKYTNVYLVFERDLKIASEHRVKQISERFDETSPPQTRHEKFVNTFQLHNCEIDILKCVYDNRAFIIIYILLLL